MPGHKHGRSRKRRPSRPRRRSGDTPVALSTPSELDQMWVVASEFDLGRAQTSLADLREMATRLPFEPAVLNVAALQARLDPILTSQERHWDLAQAFFAGRDDLLPGLETFLREGPMHVIFSPQALMLLTRVLIADARTASQRQPTDVEMRLLQDAVFGAHSAMEPLTEPPSFGVEELTESQLELDLLAYQVASGDILRPSADARRDRTPPRVPSPRDIGCSPFRLGRPCPSR